MQPEHDALELSRRKLADLLTDAVRQTAVIVEEEQRELKRRLPSVAHQVAPLMLDTSVIRELPQSRPYREAVAAYVAGRLEVNLMVRVLELLQAAAPVEFIRR